MSSGSDLYINAVKVQSERLALISKNISNSSTPGYKAKDIDFKQVLGASSSFELKSTSPGHMSSKFGSSEKFVMPSSPSLDGNTVDVESQKINFAEANQKVTEALEFLGGSYKTRLMILKGDTQ